MNKQKMWQIYFALRYLVLELRKHYIKLFYSDNEFSGNYWIKDGDELILSDKRVQFKKNTTRVGLNNDHKKLLKHINEFGSGLIPHKQLLDDPSKLAPLIFRANELLQKQDEIQEIAKKITTTKNDFKIDIPKKLIEELNNIFNKKYKYIGYAPGAGEKEKILHLY